VRRASAAEDDRCLRNRPRRLPMKDGLPSFKDFPAEFAAWGAMASA
jgi:hypothetical protein